MFCDGYSNPGILDGIRLSKAEKFCYRHNSMMDLEDKIKRTEKARIRLICTDSVFNHSGKLAKLDEIVNLAQQYGTLVMIDDSHGIGVLGEKGQGATTHHNVLGKVDLIVGSLSKSFGLGTGGFIAGRAPIISWLRQKSRPYLFSNPVSLVTASIGITSINIIKSEESPIPTLMDNTQFLRRGLIRNGFEVLESPHPIVSILTKEAVVTQKLCDALIEKGVFVVGYCYPVVPKNQAMIRLQVSSTHSERALSKVIKAFSDVAKELKIIYVPN